MHREENQPNIERAFFEDVWVKNNDGWGVMWRREDGTVKTKKGLDFKDFWSLYRGLEKFNVECMIHFRMRTNGDVNLDMCHPYHVFDDIYMMHNGIVDYPYHVSNDKSDTWAFIDQMIKPMLELSKNPYETIRDPAFMILVEQYIGSTNKLVFVDKYGFNIFNEKAFTKTTFGMNVSNTYAYTLHNPTKSTYVRRSWHYDNNFCDTDDDIYYNNWKKYGTIESKKEEPVVEVELEEEEEKVITLADVWKDDLPSHFTSETYTDDEGLEDTYFSPEELEFLHSHFNLNIEHISDFVYQQPEQAIEFIEYLINYA
jgi:predicted glutamine amidotransferase